MKLWQIILYKLFIDTPLLAAWPCAIGKQWNITFWDKENRDAAQGK